MTSSTALINAKNPKSNSTRPTLLVIVPIEHVVLRMADPICLAAAA